ncbi:MAG: aspartate--ammonia ligase [Roseburia inulinivorans]|uniref:Aspartate--ammonia ligase n=1 Tax=Roseburia inulinivorans TaxID=360807 RepID=A0A173XY36_9FIRM|nr:aspartate--ammonia ligase [Roseburia inulinivorans]CUN55368.1 Aspartate--ammonia ligase [Roseburia inulinivorans]
MEKFIIPKDYHSELNLHDTQIAIKTVKDFFQNLLSQRLNLSRVSAPLFVDPDSGLNDNLNGVERPVTFDIKEQNGREAEVVQSLAKWKRYALKKYGFSYGEGLYTDMNAIRRDEITDNIHSIFVDQWDWEKIIKKDERTIATLMDTVKVVYKCLRKTEKYMAIQYDYIEEILPHDIFFVTTQELADMFPDNTPKEREYYIAKAKGAVCIMKIGDVLENGERHDGRAPDYDDWSLNADIVVYYPVLDIALELSSMGIRVDKKALLSQLKKAGCEDRKDLPFQKAIINEELPYTIGGGIGQSRICMFFLRKAHIGEVQSSLWPEDMIAQCEENGVQLL